MKKYYSCFLAALAGVVLLGTGCATASNPTGTTSTPIVQTSTNGVLYVFGSPVTTNGVQTTMKLLGIAGASAAVQYDTNSKPYLQAVVSLLDAALSNGTYDPALLTAALKNISLNGADDPNVANGINTALAMYSTFFAATVEQQMNNASIYLVPALTGMRDGINSIVGQ